MRHTFKHFTTGEADTKIHYARCNACGHRTPDRPQQHLVGDDTLKHENDIERLRLKLGTRTPSLKDQRDYYQSKADDQSVPPEQRKLWAQLADELDHRLNDAGKAEGEQPPLW